MKKILNYLHGNDCIVSNEICFQDAIFLYYHSYSPKFSLKLKTCSEFIPMFLIIFNCQWRLDICRNSWMRFVHVDQAVYVGVLSKGYLALFPIGLLYSILYQLVSISHLFSIPLIWISNRNIILYTRFNLSLIIRYSDVKSLIYIYIQ